MSKRTYQAVPVKSKPLEKLAKELEDIERLVFAIDVAKEKMFAALKIESEPVLRTVKWNHSTQTRTVVRWLAHLSCPVEVAMEPSGTYGDTLRWQLQQAGLTVYQVSPKRVKDSREIYDGVDSTHDAKASAIIGWLHWHGRSEVWPEDSAQQRELAAAVQTLELYQLPFQQGKNRLEAQLARFWPELPRMLPLGSATLLELLMAFPAPARVVAAPKRARRLLRKVGGSKLEAKKIDAVIASAHDTLGVPPVPGECKALQTLAAETRRVHKALRAARQHIEALTQTDTVAHRIAEVVGKATAAVLLVRGGRITKYRNATCWEKALGLNLKTRSSGQYQGRLKITKRGSSVARRYLYLAALRLIKQDELARLWFEAKCQRDGGQAKKKALVALMRKLARALWWVAQGRSFDTKKLFDARRLMPASC